MSPVNEFARVSPKIVKAPIPVKSINPGDLHRTIPGASRAAILRKMSLDFKRARAWLGRSIVMATPVIRYSKPPGRPNLRSCDCR